MRIRDYVADRDADALFAMFEDVFRLGRGPEFWHWKYRDNPEGAAVISVAESEGRLVSAACALPIRMQVGGRPTRAAASVEAASRAEVRGRGIYTDVAKHLYARLAELGFSLVYGFANRYSTDLTLRVLGRTEIRPFPLRLRPVRPLDLLLSKLGVLTGAAAPTGPDRPRDARIEPVMAIDEAWDGLWDRIRDRIDIGTVRDARYLRWRYEEHPERPYEILAFRRDGRLVGYVVWRLLDRFGMRTAFVLDLLADPSDPQAAKGLIREVIRRGRGKGAHVLSLLSLPGNPPHRIVGRLPYVRVPSRLFPQPITLSLLARDAALSTRELAVAGRWCIGWGDSDVV